ncbi:MAG: hypothetical protein Q4C95_02340 [Planctomycetia bacterium]|nr:hypothetical protein [Planctomycetia bacterium]
MKKSHNWTESIRNNCWQIARSFFFVYGVIAFLATLYCLYCISCSAAFWYLSHKVRGENIFSSNDIQNILTSSQLNELKVRGEIQSFGAYSNHSSSAFEMAAFEIEPIDPNHFVSNLNERWYRGDETNIILPILGNIINDCVDYADYAGSQSCSFPKKNEILSEQYYFHFIQLTFESSIDQIKQLKVILVCPNNNKVYYIHFWQI